MHAHIARKDVMAYEFTTDWFSDRIPTFEKWLRPLIGQPLQCLEVGTHEGRSALWLLDNILTHPQSSLMCIDCWNNAEVEQRFDANIACASRNRNVHKRKGRSSLVLRSLPVESFDFVYIDGSHEGCDVLEDTILAWSLLKPGGLLAFDDYLWHLPDECQFPPRPAIDAFLLLWGPQIELLEQGWQVWVRKK